MEFRTERLILRPWKESAVRKNAVLRIITPKKINHAL